MYPELTVPLVVVFAAAVGYAAYFVLRRPVQRRLAGRQIVRRPTETLLVILGSALGTALLVASLSVGDSLDRSVRQVAYNVLGPVDEYILTADPVRGADAARRLESLATDPRVDGLLTVRGEQVSAVHAEGHRSTAEPRALMWALDFGAAGRFGAPHPSGLDVADPGRGGVVLNEHLADSLGAHRGDRVTLMLYAKPLVLTVRAVVPAEGLAGMGIGASVNRNAFISPASLPEQPVVGPAPMTMTLVSNTGDVEDGATRTAAVSATIRDRLGQLTRAGSQVVTVKQEVLDEAEQTGAIMGSLFLFIASFSIVAGVMLLVNIFVMLAEERRAQLGMLRAMGMRRRDVTAGFAVEAVAYAAGAALVGAAVGVGIGRIIVAVALTILNEFSPGDQRLDLVFDVTPTSVVNGVVAGFLVAFFAVVLTSVRIARQNIIAAIRSLDVLPHRKAQRRLAKASAVATTLLLTASVPAVVGSSGALVYLLPALAAVAAVPLMSAVVPPRLAYTSLAGLVLVWGLLANVARPHMYDDASTATYVVLGCMLSFAAVVLVTQNQALLLRPLRRVIDRPGETALATRLALAYPTAKRFRTGATLAMYSVVTLVIVLLIQISAIIDAGVDTAVRNAAASWTMRADFNASSPLANPDRDLRNAAPGKIDRVEPILTATADGDDPARRTSDRFPVLAIGVRPGFAEGAPVVKRRLPSLNSGAEAWRLVARDSRYVLVDQYYGAAGGPQGAGVEPGDRVDVWDGRTGRKSSYIIAGLLEDGTAFYGIDPGEYRFPIIMAAHTATTNFPQAALTSAFVRTRADVDVAALRPLLQGTLLTNGLVATDLHRAVEDSYTASQQMFRMMQGYLALGLLVGITGLGVIMVRAVRERRRTIGVLRALGFRASTVRRSFVTESAFIAIEGVVIGTVLGVLVTWILYTNSPAFGGLSGPFPVAWAAIAITVGGTLIASLFATVGPARRAAAIRPAVAVRVAD
jgi:putative ABC transport system permease protein